MASVGDHSKGSFTIFTRVLEIITENSERLGRQAQPEIEPSTFPLSILKTEYLGYWQGSFQRNISKGTVFLWLGLKKKNSDFLKFI